MSNFLTTEELAKAFPVKDSFVANYAAWRRLLVRWRDIGYLKEGEHVKVKNASTKGRPSRTYDLQRVSYLVTCWREGTFCADIRSHYMTKEG